MDVIITGATGFIGGAVVRRAIASRLVNHAYILTRKPLSEFISKHSKITEIIHADFLTYPEALMERLAGCEACIWCIGGRAYKFPDIATAKKVCVDYPLAAATAFMDHLAPRPDKFKFLYVSGKFAEWDEKKSLFFLRDTRRIKGTAEQRLLALASISQSRLEVHIARPGGIMAMRGGCVQQWLAKRVGFIFVDHLARGLVAIAEEGGGYPIIEMRDLMKL
ncbi:hypothetical protein CHU98_g2772 [Xylaria longipes]|nr:hypothetical protein CHU98_g2772 [Xylaria longipes]